MPTKTLLNGMTYTKATHHNDKTLEGHWEITYKIDGVRAFQDPQGNIVSRNSKPLYNLDKLQFTDAEIYRDNWETSVSLVRSQQHKSITQDDVYQLTPDALDPRLTPKKLLINPPCNERLEAMQEAINLGYEGIVLRKVTSRNTQNWIKIVPTKTADVRITGYIMSTKRKGFIKCFLTKHGNISATGFPIIELTEITLNTPETYIGKIAEVQFREWTPQHKMRFPAWVRWRFDKTEESLT